MKHLLRDKANFQVQKDSNYPSEQKNNHKESDGNQEQSVRRYKKDLISFVNKNMACPKDLSPSKHAIFVLLL